MHGARGTNRLRTRNERSAPFLEPSLFLARRAAPRGKVDVQARITDEVKKGVLSTTFHFPDIMLNNITSSVSDSEAMCPEYKVVAVRIRRTKGKRKQMVSAEN